MVKPGQDPKPPATSVAAICSGSSSPCSPVCHRSAFFFSRSGLSHHTAHERAQHLRSKLHNHRRHMHYRASTLSAFCICCAAQLSWLHDRLCYWVGCHLSTRCSSFIIASYLISTALLTNTHTSPLEILI